jgi:hypothetical protein
MDASHSSRLHSKGAGSQRAAGRAEAEGSGVKSLNIEQSLLVSGRAVVLLAAKLYCVVVTS